MNILILNNAVRHVSGTDTMVALEIDLLKKMGHVVVLYEKKIRISRPLPA